jgi:putative ABC transport system permease protein
LTATTAGALALLGAILGLARTYIALVSALHSNLGALTGVPISHLAAITAGLPLLAAVAGWLLCRAPAAGVCPPAAWTRTGPTAGADLRRH